MSDDIATYSFLPWLRQGIGTRTAAPAAGAKRGVVTVRLQVTGEGLTNPADATVEKTISIHGPGDIIGIDSRTIVKTEPRNWVTNFEPNYLPHIEFYDEDFPWRYTPNAPAGTRLIPWLTLLVLAEGEFAEGKDRRHKPLGYIDLAESVDPASVFPPQDDLWAWAHVHVNRDILGGEAPVSSDEAAFIERFKGVLRENPDLAYSRLLSPRKLDANTGYHAFLVPTFESGRLAGLGFDPDGASGFDANTIAWSAYSGREAGTYFPYYHRWYFRTASLGDFEYLVRLLKPRIADSRVGHRDIDVQAPGWNVDGITEPQLGGVLRLGGALRVPAACLGAEERDEHRLYDNWHLPYPREFQKKLARFINLAEDYKSKTTLDAHAATGIPVDDENPDDPDPLVTPPLYGRWHSLTPRVLYESDGTYVENNVNWVHELNLDPRWRSAANFGTSVIQKHQEEYMDAAWDQAGDVLEANRRLRWSGFAAAVSKSWYRKDFLPGADVSPEYLLTLTAPVQSRVISAGKTVAFNVKGSRVPHALLSPPVRRVLRPRGRFVKRLPFDGERRPDNLVERVNAGRVDPAPPRPAGDDLLTHEDVVSAVQPEELADWLWTLLRRCPRLPVLLLVLALLIAAVLLLLGPAGYAAAAAIAAGGIALFRRLRRLGNQVRAATRVLPANQVPSAIDALPASPDFHITEPGDAGVPAPGAPGSRDSEEAARLKQALKTSFDFVARSRAAGQVPERRPLDIAAVVNDVVVNIDPAVTIPRHTFGQVTIPARILDALDTEKFTEVMAYPEIDVPMYKPLIEASVDNFVPNLDLIEPNSITLLETNQRFIEAYMVGLNHEMARELLWREYFTDQRGSYFRQFWDVSSYRNSEGADAEALREKLRDIPPLHRWSRRSRLGDHDHREQGADKEEEVVLVIRGELLKKYPTAVVYAHRARWATNADGKRVLAEPRDFDDSEPDSVVIKTPLYEAKAEPDIYFFGFDLTVPEAKGGSGEHEADRAGWFFVIKERPGEPRFGLDVPGETADFEVTRLASWADLAWSHVVPDVAPGKFIEIGGSRSITVSDPGTVEAGNEARQQQKEDSSLRWGSSMNAAELAYILYQVPVLVAVHAAEMLPDKCDADGGMTL